MHNLLEIKYLLLHILFTLLFLFPISRRLPLFFQTLKEHLIFLNLLSEHLTNRFKIIIINIVIIVESVIFGLVVGFWFEGGKIRGMGGEFV